MVNKSPKEKLKRTLKRVQGRTIPFRCRRGRDPGDSHSPKSSGSGGQGWREPGRSRGLSGTRLRVGPAPGWGRASTRGVHRSAPGRLGWRGAGEGRVEENLAAALRLGESVTAPNLGVRHTKAQPLTSPLSPDAGRKWSRPVDPNRPC